MATAEIEIFDAETGEVTTALVPRAKGNSLARREQMAGLLRPVAPVDEVIEAQNEVRALVARALQEGRDYGKIPGTDKATLLKPGAERINAAYGIAAEYLIAEKEVDHDRSVVWHKRKKKWRNAHQGDREFTWEEENGVSHGLYRYVIECRLIHRASGVMVGQGLGSCSTMESKYIDRPREMENTVIKMAGKRAYVAATLNTHGLSDQFTQDMEDFAAEEGGNAAATNGTGKPAVSEKLPVCPICSGPCWDNRPKKASGEYAANAPDFKCKKKDCDGKVWPEKEGATAAEVAAELDRQSAIIDLMIKELSGMSAERADAARTAYDDLLRTENVTLEMVRKLGGQVGAALKEERSAAAAEAVTAGV